MLLGRLNDGTTRHRALLFKVLADGAKIKCKLLRGLELCGDEGTAMVVVSVDGRELLVDLVHEPGRLYTQDEFVGLCKLQRAREHPGPAPSAPVFICVCALLWFRQPSPAGKSGLLVALSMPVCVW